MPSSVSGIPPLPPFWKGTEGIDGCMPPIRVNFSSSSNGDVVRLAALRAARRKRRTACPTTRRTIADMKRPSGPPASSGRPALAAIPTGVLGAPGDEASRPQGARITATA